MQHDAHRHKTLLTAWKKRRSKKDIKRA